MNEENIERLLKKAPRPLIPPGLVQRLHADISLPRATREAVRWNSPAPRFKRWLPALSFCVFLLGCAIIIAMQSAAISNLQNENRALAQETREADTAGAQNQPLPRAQLESLELERLRKEDAELQTLRTEAAQLRQQAASLNQLRAENQKLQAELTALASASGDEGLEKQRSKAESIKCVNNLKNIGLAARIFATEHSDVFPPDFVTMKDEISTPKILHCPSDLGRTETANWSEFGSGNSSYEMLAPGFKESAEATSVVFVRCTIHGHVCLADGSVFQNPEQNGAKLIMRYGKQVLIRPGQPASFE